MLETKQDRKRDATGQESRLPAAQHDREDKDTVHEAIVLEVDMIDDEQARR